MGEKNGEQELHAVVFPYPGQGHINPLMQLSLHLSSMGFFVTFVTAAGNHTSIKDAWAKQGTLTTDSSSFHRIRMASIPDDVLPPRKMGGTFKFIAGLKKLKEPFETLMEQLMADSTSPPVSCIICDAIMMWMWEVANKFGAHWIPFFPFPAATFLVLHHAPALAAQGLLGGEEMIHLPGLAPLHPLELPSQLDNPDDVEQNMWKELSRMEMDAPLLLINTCETLEHDALEAMRAQGFTNVVTVAPLLPPSFIEPSSKGSDLATSSLWLQDTSCMEWLDSQPPRSVLYVSFGSIVDMRFGDMETLLDGILSSGVKFLWVLRRDLLVDVREDRYEEFLRRAALKGDGKIVNWAPQLRVLLHDSIAAFLTHSGWNSTFESICAGVPMICWPCFVEQKMNAKYISDVWRVGVKVAETHHLAGNVSVEQVERVVTEVVKGETGKMLRQNVRELSSACKEDFVRRNGLETLAVQLK